MLTPEERLLIGLKVLERFKPDLRARRQRNIGQLAGRTQSAKVETFSEAAGVETVFEMPEYPFVSLQAFIEQAGTLPSCSLILGVCDDGLPLLIELDNPAPGSLLIVGDAGAGKSRLLSAILSSTVLLNTAGQVVFHLVSPDPEAWLDFSQVDHCQNLLSPEEFATGGWIEALIAVAEGRQRGDRRGPAYLLTIEHLEACLPTLDDEQFARLYWLVKHGPRSRIWVIASLSSEQVVQVDERLIAAFRTHLIGSIADPDLAVYFTRSDHSGIEELAAGYQFGTLFGDELLRFWICSPD